MFFTACEPEALQCYSLLHEGESASLAQGQARSLCTPLRFEGNLRRLIGINLRRQIESLFCCLIRHGRGWFPLLSRHRSPGKCTPCRQMSSVRRAWSEPHLSIFFFFFDINEDKHFEICMFTLKVFCTENDDLRNLRTSKRGILVGIPKTCSISYLLGHSRLLLRLLIYQHW